MTWKTIAALLLLLAAALATLVVLRREDSRHRPASNTGTAGHQAESIEAMLRDTAWQRRAAAAWSLTTRGELPVRKRADLLLQVLQREITSPTNAPVISGSWPPFSNFLRIHYLRVLEILGSEAQEPVSNAHKRSSGELREWYTLALGATMSPEARPGLRELLAHSRDSDVRMTAARYLGWLKDREAVPQLRAALGDTASALPVSDTRGPTPRRFYPVREQAALALEELGMKVERRGSTFSVQ